MKNKNYLSDQIRNNIPKRNIEEGRESVRMFVEMLKKRKINVIDEAILNRAYEEEDYVDEKMLGLVLKALKIDEPVQYIPRYIIMLQMLSDIFGILRQMIHQNF